jgi:hypothetical protein
MKVVHWVFKHHTTPLWATCRLWLSYRTLTHVRRFHLWAREVVVHHFVPTREVNLTDKDDSFWFVLR